MRIINNTTPKLFCIKYQQNNQTYSKNLPCFRSHNFLDLPEQEIFSKIKASITPDNFLGHGTNAEVYRIKNTEYCVRIPYIANDIYRFNYSKELSPVDKVNHVVAKLGFGATIMKYFEGVIPKWFMNNSHDRYKLQKTISEMPIKSYSELLHQIADAIDNEMLFDFSPGNLIVDKEKQKLTAIDFYPISEISRPIRPLNEMYSVLTCYGSLKETGKKIFDNIIEAGFEEFKPNVIPCMDVELFDFIDLCLKRESEIFPPRDSYEYFKNLQTQFTELKKLKKAEIRNKSVSTKLAQQTDKIKDLIKHIR